MTVKSEIYNKFCFSLLQLLVTKKYNRTQGYNIVLISNEDEKRLPWPLAKVIKLFPNKHEIDS